MAESHKYIITGATGKIGTELLSVLDRDDFVVFTRSPKKLDRSVNKFVTDLSRKIDTNRFKKYDTVIHLAAETHIERCESGKKEREESPAWINNVVATKNITEFCMTQGKRLIMLSTESVFGGNKKIYSEEDLPVPKSWYGITKLESEKIIVNSLENFAVLRTVMAYGGVSGKTDLPRFIYQRLKNKEKVYLATDQKIAFTYTGDIVKALLLLSRKKAKGFYHFCGPDALTPYGLGKLIAKKYNLDRNLLVPKTMRELHGKRNAGLRLSHAVLSNKKFIENTGFKSYTNLETGLKFTL